MTSGADPGPCGPSGDRPTTTVHPGSCLASLVQAPASSSRRDVRRQAAPVVEAREVSRCQSTFAGSPVLREACRRPQRGAFACVQLRVDLRDALVPSPSRHLVQCDRFPEVVRPPRHRPIGQLRARRPPYTQPDLVAVAAGLLETLGLTRAHVVGISMGGGIARSGELDPPTQSEPRFSRAFSNGSDGTRTRDLRRDRPAVCRFSCPSRTATPSPRVCLDAVVYLLARRKVASSGRAPIPQPRMGKSGQRAP